ncbi:nitroreductase family protein [Nocardia sp. NPDC050175]|uniref:nitroreductase family protein n=1 Tax=Nocardia sp. NPDC050175 TaxID=3364317 RepID=UPI0037A25D62
MTTRAIRRKLDLETPVSRDVVRDCLDMARYAPSGGNRQSWGFLAIDDAGTRTAVARYYRQAFEAYVAAAPSAARSTSTARSAQFLAEHLHRVPVLVLACATGRPPVTEGPVRLAGYYGSVFPAVWSFMLAARSRGLGTSLTTVHLTYEREVATLLGIPFDRVAQIALLPVGYLRGSIPRPAARIDVDSIMCWNRWTVAAP